MMRPEIAHNSAMFMLMDVRPMLHKIWASNQPLEFHRLFLNAVRDRLHSSCVHFETHGGAEEYEEIYLPIFDALSLLTDALLKKPVDRVSARGAIDQLDALAELLSPVTV